MSRSRALLLSALALVASLWLAVSPRVEARIGLQAGVLASCAAPAGDAAWSGRPGRNSVPAALPIALEDQESDPPEALGTSTERARPVGGAAAKAVRSACAGHPRRAELPLSTGPPGA